MVLSALNPNLISIPKNLSDVTTIDYASEVDPQDVGISQKEIDAIWRRVEKLYGTRVQPGISLAIRHKGQLVMNRAIGHARGNAPKNKAYPDAFPDKQLMLPETPVCLFSASKAITAMLVHQMSKEGLIKLHDPVAEYIPKFGTKGKQFITVGEVLAHKAGIPTIEQDEPDPSMLWDWDGVIDILSNAQPRRDARTAQAYHAITGGFILGEIMRRVTGQSLKDIYKQRLQAPMGADYMTLGIEPQHHDKVAVNYFTGFEEQFPVNRIITRALGGSMRLVTDVSNSNDFLTADIPAGNVYANALETCNFFQTLLEGGKREGHKRMFKRTTVARAINEAAPRQFDRTLMAPLRTSEGLMLGDSPFGLYGPHTKDAFGHLGFLNIFCWADPSRDISVSMLTTGKALIAPHMPALAKLLVEINRSFPRAR